MARECGLSELVELALDAPVQRQIIESNYRNIKPMGPVAGATEIDFYVKNNADTFIDLPNSELVTKFRVKKGNNNLAGTDKVSVINAIGATMFDTIDVWLGDELVTERTPNQAFRAIVEMLTGYGRDAAGSWMQSALFFKDTAGQMDNTDPAPAQATDPVNEGLKRRYEYVKESKLVSVRTAINADLFRQPRPLVNFVPLRIKLHLNKNEYSLMSDKTDAPYNIAIEDMTLRLRFIKLADEIYRSIVTKTVLYPYTRVRIKEDIIPAGGKSHNIANFVSGVLPQKIIGLVANEASNGSYKKNPFHFQHFNLSEMALIVNGTVHGSAPLELDYVSNQFEEGYWELFSATGKKYRDDGMLIEREDYKSGYALYAFHISPSACNIGEYKDPERNGNINIACKFSVPIPSTLTLCAYLQFENTITINPAKRVTTDF